VSSNDSAARREVGHAGDGHEVVRHMAETAARAATGMFAEDVVLIDRRVVEEVLERMNEEGYRPRSRRYDEGSAWISLDYLDVVVHVFTDEARDYYRLESLWRSAPQEHWEEQEERS
jgi:ribosome-associated protein